MNIRTLLTVALAGVAATVCYPAKASDYEIGTALLCDTQAQAERFASLFTGDAQATARVVNTELNDPTACVLQSVVFVRGSRVGMTYHADIAYEVVRILVVGVEADSGIQNTRPAVYYTLFGIREFAV